MILKKVIPFFDIRYDGNQISARFKHDVLALFGKLKIQTGIFTVTFIAEDHEYIFDSEVTGQKVIIDCKTFDYINDGDKFAVKYFSPQTGPVEYVFDTITKRLKRVS